MLRKRDIKSEVFIEFTRRSIIAVTASLNSSESKRRIIPFIRPITPFQYMMAVMTLLNHNLLVEK